LPVSFANSYGIFQVLSGKFPAKPPARQRFSSGLWKGQASYIFLMGDKVAQSVVKVRFMA
jgi:hypothetical protein